MHVEPIDPRDIAREGEPITYRVYFHKDARTHFESNRVTGADSVHEVIAWANAWVEASDWEYDLYAEIHDGDSAALIELSIVGRPG